MTKNFIIRAASALVALAALIALYVFWKDLGMKLAVLIAVVIGTYEAQRLLLKDSALNLKIIFSLLTFIVFALSALTISVASVAFALAVILFCIASLVVLHKTAPLEQILSQQAKAALGLFYIGLLPAFVVRLLSAAQGVEWFATLLAVVFAGDTLAYIFGVTMGKTKLMPAVSPKKSLQGSLGGLLGSVIAMLICRHFFFPDMSLLAAIPLALCTGIAAQFGDFFESLIKRVADMKDSGRIMPGHGGILDRIDGVLFAAPVILLGLILIEYFN
jgi:phosphatidate cytidylyltransferase